MDENLNLLELRYELLKQELIEYKIYIEICAITIFFLLTVYIKKLVITNESVTNLVLNYIIIISAIILFVSIILMTARIIYLLNTDMKTIKSYKNMKINNLLWAFR